jgi:hypothetical protein
MLIEHLRQDETFYIVTAISKLGSKRARYEFRVHEMAVDYARGMMVVGYDVRIDIIKRSL